MEAPGGNSVALKQPQPRMCRLTLGFARRCVSLISLLAAVSLVGRAQGAGDVVAFKRARLCRRMYATLGIHDGSRSAS